VKRTVFKSPADSGAVYILFFFIINTYNIYAQDFSPVTISDDFEPEEVSIAISPADPALMVAGSNLDRVYTSKDSGRTWTNKTLESKYGVYGDPCVVAGGGRRFYYFHLSNYKKGTWIDRIVCQRSEDGGASWNKGSYTGLNGSKNQDKHWVYVLPGKERDTIYVAWTQFDKYESKEPGDSSTILFSASYNNGKTFSKPEILSHYRGDCLDSDNTVEGAVPAVHPDGTVLVAWAGPKGLMVNSSADRGKSFSQREKKICEMPGGWDMKMEGLFRANGLPVLVCDRSNGPHRGRFYVCWGEDRNNNGDPDIWLSFSDDKGTTWSQPSKINRDPGNAPQCMPWICLSKETGRVYCLFYDRRRAGETTETEVWLAWSDDGGKSFSEKPVSASPFVPDPKTFFGDYLNITCSGGLLRPVWMELRGEKLSMQTLLLKEKDLP
jgi:hypothetical protein